MRRVQSQVLPKAQQQQVAASITNPKQSGNLDGIRRSQTSTEDQLAKRVRTAVKTAVKTAANSAKEKKVKEREKKEPGFLEECGMSQEQIRSLQGLPPLRTRRSNSATANPALPTKRKEQEPEQPATPLSPHKSRSGEAASLTVSGAWQRNTNLPSPQKPCFPSNFQDELPVAAGKKSFRPPLFASMKPPDTSTIGSGVCARPRVAPQVDDKKLQAHLENIFDQNIYRTTAKGLRYKSQKK